MTKTLIILAGGASSRMKKSDSSDLSVSAIKEANTKSKALIQINKRPVLDYILYNAKRAGLIDIIIVTRPDDSMFKTQYGHKAKGNEYHGLTISFARQYIPANRIKPLGTADALMQALVQYPDLQQKSFLVCNSDNLYSVAAFQNLCKNKDSNAFINYDREALNFSSERIAGFALTKVNTEGYLEDIIEKPSSEEADRYKDIEGKLRVSMNIWKFNGPLFLPYLEKCPINPARDEKELPSAILAMIREHKRSMKTIPFSEHVPDLTAKNDIAVMIDYLSTHYSDLDWTK
jgi:glucose-1-phosphate adenylyltransferase